MQRRRTPTPICSLTGQLCGPASSCPSIKLKRGSQFDVSQLAPDGVDRLRPQFPSLWCGHLLCNKVVADRLRDGTLLCPDLNMGRCAKGDRCTVAHRCAVMRRSGRVCGGHHSAQSCRERKFLAVEAPKPAARGRGADAPAHRRCILITVSKARPVALRASSVRGPSCPCTACRTGAGAAFLTNGRGDAQSSLVVASWCFPRPIPKTRPCKSAAWASPWSRGAESPWKALSW